MDPTLHEHNYDEMKADVVWKKLKNLFTRKTSRNKTTWIRTLVNLKYMDGNNMVEHISSFQGIVTKLVAMKMNIDMKCKHHYFLAPYLIVRRHVW